MKAPGRVTGTEEALTTGVLSPKIWEDWEMRKTSVDKSQVFSQKVISQCFASSCEVTEVIPSLRSKAVCVQELR